MMGTSATPTIKLLGGSVGVRDGLGVGTGVTGESVGWAEGEAEVGGGVGALEGESVGCVR